MVGRAGCDNVPAFLLVFCAAVVCAQWPGALECPCIKSDNSYNQLVDGLSATATANFGGFQTTTGKQGASRTTLL